MAKKPTPLPADYIVPLDINGLQGRLLHMPAPKGKSEDLEIMFVYGAHSSLERWWGLIQVLNRYAAVTMPDLPGFGGMDSLYKIGKEPTIDNLADYLAAFVKMRYKHKKVVIAGMSFGFVVATRMLQRYPELTKNVKMLVSIVGFADAEDFTFSKPRYYAYLWATWILSHRLPAAIFRHTALQPFVLRKAYARTHNAKNKFAQAQDEEEFNFLMDIEIGLWHDNDVRTWCFTTNEFMRFSNCNVKVDLPVWHVGTTSDHFFDNHVVEQHMRIIFSDFEMVKIDMTAHAPSVIADAKSAAAFIPTKLARKLASLK